MNNLEAQAIHTKAILRFALPSMIMMVIMSLYTVVDGMFVSRLVGSSAFSAVNIIYPLLSLCIGIGTMMGTGITSIVSRKMGEGSIQEARSNFTLIVICSLLLGCVLSILGFIGMDMIIRLLGANEGIAPYCQDYLFPLLFFLPANILQLQFQNLYVANGKPKIGLTMTIIGGVANIVLDYIFITQFDMGISGAGLATGIGYAIPALFGLWYFAQPYEAALHFVKPAWDLRVIQKTMSNGSSEMVSCLSTSVTTFLFNIIMMRLLGEDGVAAIAILLYLDFILVAVNLGYAIGVAPLFGYHYGKDNRQEVHRLFQISVRFCITVGIGMTICSILFAAPLTAIFVSTDTGVYALTITGLQIFAIGYLCKGYNLFASALFTAFGNGRVSAILSFMRTLCFLVVCLLGFSILWGVSGVWWATPSAEVLAMILSLFFTIRYAKQYHFG